VSSFPKPSLADHFRRNPGHALFWIGFVFTILIIPMNPLLMVSDSLKRFRSASWIIGGENPGGFLPGVGGATHYWYGLGQSLVFIPFDRALSALGVTNLVTRYSVTARLLYPLTNGLVLVLSWDALRLLGFRSRHCVLGTLVTLGVTTLPFHFQNNQENPLTLVCALTALVGILRWNDSGSLLWLNLACAAQAESILIRVTNLAYVLPLFGLPLLSRLLDRSRPLDPGREFRQTARLATVAIPWLVVAFAADRWWQLVRFGTWSGTYMTIFQNWATSNFGGLPKGFPFSVPFRDGLVLQLVSPGKGVLFYEPLLVAAIVFGLSPWSRSSPRTRALVLTGVVATLGTIVGLAQFYYWDSEPNWGPRYLASTAFLAELPLAAWVVSQLPRGAWRTRILAGVAGCLLVVQISGIWWPGYHENVECVHRKGPEHVRRTSEFYTRGLPLQEPDGHTDWRFIDRPKGVIADLWRQMTLPGDAWVAGNPPMRMVWVTGELKSLSPASRWAIRLVWLAGLGLVFWLAREALLGEPKSRESETPDPMPL